MSTEETLVNSPLDKPLQFLTEDDISQLTREDCRKFLKQKGMRRPSWNKSQAIQQVISLKRLFETTPDSGKKKLYSTPSAQYLPPSACRSSSGEENCGEGAGDEAVPYRRQDLERSDYGEDIVCNRDAGVLNGPPGQLTIFYCGNVNVYDGVPAEKARSIVQLAASPHQLSKAVLLEENTARQFGGIHFHSPNMKEIPESPALAFATSKPGFVGDISDNYRLRREDSGTFCEDNPGDGSCNRKASVQRYLEKRKDRFKGKTKVKTPSCASLEMYANHPVGNQTVDEVSKRSDMCSSPQIRPPNTPSQCSYFGGE